MNLGRPTAYSDGDGAAGARRLARWREVTRGSTWLTMTTRRAGRRGAVGGGRGSAREAADTRADAAGRVLRPAAPAAAAGRVADPRPVRRGRRAGPRGGARVDAAARRRSDAVTPLALHPQTTGSRSGPPGPGDGRVPDDLHRAGAGGHVRRRPGLGRGRGGTSHRRAGRRGIPGPGSAAARRAPHLGTGRPRTPGRLAADLGLLPMGRLARHRDPRRSHPTPATPARRAPPDAAAARPLRAAAQSVTRAANPSGVCRKSRRQASCRTIHRPAPSPARGRGSPPAGRRTPDRGRRPRRRNRPSTRPVRTATTPHRAAERSRGPRPPPGASRTPSPRHRLRHERRGEPPAEVAPVGSHGSGRRPRSTQGRGAPRPARAGRVLVPSRWASTPRRRPPRCGCARRRPTTGAGSGPASYVQRTQAGRCAKERLKAAS